MWLFGEYNLQSKNDRRSKGFGMNIDILSRPGILFVSSLLSASLMSLKLFT